MQGQHKKFKYLDFLPDNTPFGMVEINMKTLVKNKTISESVYADGYK